jgi:hypothetical protein
MWESGRAQAKSAPLIVPDFSNVSGWSDPGLRTREQLACDRSRLRGEWALDFPIPIAAGLWLCPDLPHRFWIRACRPPRWRLNRGCGRFRQLNTTNSRKRGP